MSLELGKFQKQFDEMFKNANSVEEYLKGAQQLKTNLDNELSTLTLAVEAKKTQLTIVTKECDEKLTVMTENFERTRVTEMERLKGVEDALNARIAIEDKRETENLAQTSSLQSQASNMIIKAQQNLDEAQKLTLEARNTLEKLEQREKVLTQRENHVTQQESFNQKRTEELDQYKRNNVAVTKEIQNQAAENQRLLENIILEKKSLESLKQENEKILSEVKTLTVKLTERELDVKTREDAVALREKNASDKETNLENFQRELEFELAKVKNERK